MPILRITAAEVGQIARLDVASDTQAASDVELVLECEQDAIEQTLDPWAFGVAAGVGDLLRRNVAKLLAAEVLEMRAREAGASGDVQVGGGSGEIRLSRVPDFPAALRAQANAALVAYRRREPVLPTSGFLSSALPTASPRSDRGIQDRLYGPTEMERTVEEVARRGVCDAR